MSIAIRHSRLAALIIAAFAVSGAAVAQAPAGAPPAGASAAATVRTIQEIKFTGNKKISTEQLSKAIGIKVGDVNTKEAVGGAMDKIGEAYKKIGSDVSYMVDITPTPTTALINFIIDENGTGGNKGAAPRSGGMGAGGPPPGGAPGGAPPAPAK